MNPETSNRMNSAKATDSRISIDQGSTRPREGLFPTGNVFRGSRKRSEPESGRADDRKSHPTRPVWNQGQLRENGRGAWTENGAFAGVRGFETEWESSRRAIQGTTATEGGSPRGAMSLFRGQRKALQEPALKPKKTNDHHRHAKHLHPKIGWSVLVKQVVRAIVLFGKKRRIPESSDSWIVISVQSEQTPTRSKLG